MRTFFVENVYRTNTASAYSAGKLMQYEKTKPVAYELFVINDERTSKICRHLLRESGYGMALPANHGFWKKYGFPPYHYQCRTGIRAVDAASVGANPKDGGVNVENVPMKRFAKFKPQEGFGGNPLDRGNWYMMQPSQIERAIKYGILGMFNREDNVFADYDSVWKGYTRHNGKKGGWYDVCENPPQDWETNNKPIVEFLANEGYKIKVIPSIENIKNKYNVKWSNPDIFINGVLSDIKGAQTSVLARLDSARKQHVKTVVLDIPDTFSEKQIRDSFLIWESKHHSPIKILWIYKGKCTEVTI